MELNEFNRNQMNLFTQLIYCGIIIFAILLETFLTFFSYFPYSSSPQSVSRKCLLAPFLFEDERKGKGMGAKTLIRERKRAKRFGTGEKEDGEREGKEKEEGFRHLGMGSGPRTKLVSVFGWGIDGGMCRRREKPSKGNGMGSSRAEGGIGQIAE